MIHNEGEVQRIRYPHLSGKAGDAHRHIIATAPEIDEVERDGLLATLPYKRKSSACIPNARR